MKRTFIPPNPNPAPRMVGKYKATRFYSMFWNWMGENNTGIGTWSTDECVDRQWATLVEARAQLVAWSTAPPGNCTTEDIQGMIDQLDNVMRRGTRNRLMDDNGVAVKPAANQIASDELAKAIDSKPAVKADDVDDIIGGFRG